MPTTSRSVKWSAPAAFRTALSFVMLVLTLLLGAPAYASTTKPPERIVLSPPSEDDKSAQPLLTGDTEDTAIAQAKAYLAVHNAHDLERVMSYYAQDATFQLSNGRELVSGRENIRELERFDAIAKSTLIPFGWSAQKTGDGWAISVHGVLENSIVFSAVGLNLVVAKPEKPVFLLRNSLIQHSEQPSLLPACGEAVMTAFDGVTNWLTKNKDPRGPGLISKGRLRLEPHLLPMIAQLIAEWRSSTGWSPSAQQVWDCGSVDSVLSDRQ